MCYCSSKNLYKKSDVKYNFYDSNDTFSDNRDTENAFIAEKSQNFEKFQNVIDNREIQLPLDIQRLDFYNIYNNPNIFQEYYYKNIPVIIENAISDWPALDKWSPQYLSNKIKSPISVDLTPDGFADSIKSKYFVQPFQVQMTLKNYFLLLHEQAKNLIGYVQKQNNNFNQEFSDLLNDINSDFKRFFSLQFGKEPDAFNFWLGGKQSVSSLHKDPYENLYSVIHGEKHFTLIHPMYYPFMRDNQYTNSYFQIQDIQQNQLIEDIDRIKDKQFTLKKTDEKLNWISYNPEIDENQYIKKYHIILQKGEVLYLPSFWYHQVSQYDDEYILAVNYWWDMEFGTSHHTLYELIRSLC